MSVTQHDNLFLAHDKAICSGSLYTFFVEQGPGQPRRSATAVHNDLRHEIGEVLLLHKQCLCILSVPRRFPNKAFDVKFSSGALSFSSPSIDCNLRFIKIKEK